MAVLVRAGVVEALVATAERQPLRQKPSALTYSLTHSTSLTQPHPLSLTHPTSPTHLTSPHLTSPHLTPHLTSPHLTSRTHSLTHSHSLNLTSLNLSHSHSTSFTQPHSLTLNLTHTQPYSPNLTHSLTHRFIHSPTHFCLVCQCWLFVGIWGMECPRRSWTLRQTMFYGALGE